MARPLNFRQLEAFRAVMLTGSITSAGHVMSISQPAVSRLVQDLEIELKLTLFTRVGPKVVPTEEARELFSEVERHFVGAERIRKVADALRLTETGCLRIGCMPTLSAVCLPRAVKMMLEQHGQLFISVHPDSSLNLTEMLIHGQLDVAYATPPSVPRGLTHTPLAATSAVCLVPDRHPLAEKSIVTVIDLQDQDLISLGSTSVQRMQLESAMQEAGVHPKIRLEVDYSPSVVNYVRQSVGVAILDPLALAGADCRGLKVIYFETKILMHFSAIYRYAPAPLRHAVTFSRILEAVVAEELGFVVPSIPSA